MSHWCRRATEGAEFWISCKWLKLLRKAGVLQLIQNSAPSVAQRRQCDIWIWSRIENRVKMSYYIKPNDISSALVFLYFKFDITSLRLKINSRSYYRISNKRKKKQKSLKEQWKAKSCKIAILFDAANDFLMNLTFT